MARFAGYFKKGGEADAFRNQISSAREFRGWEIEENGPLILAFDPRYVLFKLVDNVFCLISGDLLLPGSSSRDQDAEMLCEKIARRPNHAALDAFLRTCRGNFTLVFGNWSDDPEIRLVTDSVATRPLYVWRDLFGAGFSGQSSLVWRLGGLDPNKWDQRGLQEKLCFGYPLGQRTDHPNLSVLDYATIWTVGSENISKRTYRRWRQAPEQETTGIDHAARILEAFRSAVAVRAKRFGAEHCMISGGMDSRMVAVELRRQGRTPVFHNFGRPGSLDFRIAESLVQEWSATLNARTFDIEKAFSMGGMERIISKVVHDYCDPRQEKVLPVWAGDGGSLMLGGIHLDEKIGELLSEGKKKAAIRHFVRRNHFALPPRIVSKEMQKYSAEVFFEKEFRHLSDKAMISALFHFLMANDQRRHLWRAHEHCEELNIDRITPFCDPVFLEAVDACPVNEIIAHKIYTRIYDLLPGEARVVGWQTYPGHAPSSVPVLSGGDYQWDDIPEAMDFRATRVRSWDILHAAISSRYWPSSLLPLWKAVIPAVLVLFGKHSLSYLVSLEHEITKLVAVRKRGMSSPMSKD